MKHAISSLPARAESGQTVLLITVVFVSITVLVTGLFATSGLTQYRNSKDFLSSQRSFFGAEAILEDVAYRKVNNKGVDQIVDGSYNVGIDYDGDISTNDIVGTLDITPGENSLSDKYVALAGPQQVVRKASFNLVPTSQGNWSADLQVGLLGVELRNNASVRGQIYTNGPISGIGPLNNIAFLKPLRTSYLQVAQQKSVAETEKNPGIDSSDQFVYLRKTNTTDNIAQQFIPDYSGWMQGFTVYICEYGGDFTGQIDFSLRSNIYGGGSYAVTRPDGGAIQGSAVGQLLTPDLVTCPILPLNSVPATSDYNLMKKKVLLNSPYLVQAGVPYWFVISPPTCSGCGKYYKMIATPNTEYGGSDLATTTLWADTNGTSAEWCRAPLGNCNSTNVLTSVAVDLAFIAHISTEPGFIKNIKVVSCQTYDEVSKTCTAPVNWAGVGNCGGPTSNAPFILAGDISAAAILVEPHSDTVDGNNPTFTNYCGADGVTTASSAPPALVKPYTQEMIDEWKMAAGWLPAGSYRKNNTNDPGGICGVGHPDWNGTDCSLKSYSAASQNNGCDPSNDFNDISATLPATTLDHAVIRNFTHRSGTLSIKNYLYVTGDLTIGGGTNCELQIDSGASSGDNSLVIVVEGRVDVGNCTIQGKLGNIVSHILIVSLYPGIYEETANTHPAIWIHNSSNSDLFYAHNGLVQLNNSAEVNAIYGERVIMEQTATIRSVLEGIGQISFEDTGVQTSSEPSVSGNWREVF